MTRNKLTDLYLEHVRRRGDKAAELIATQPDSEMLNALYKGRYLSRPLFLEAAEREQLHRDVENVRTALTSLPDRLFGGDLAAFARAVGMDEVQAAAVARSRAPQPTRFTRADMYADASGFRLMEFNMGSTLGGVDNAQLSRALLTHPGLAEFAEEHKLSLLDTAVEQMNTLYAETGTTAEGNPFIALTDWPTSFEDLGPYLHHVTANWAKSGIEAEACHVGQLEARDGGIWLNGRRVDVVYRLFMLEDLVSSPEAPALFEPVLAAVERGEVKIFTPLDAEVYASKGALAMLSDEANRHLFSSEELASLDRTLPWTRMVREGLVSLEDGSSVDLLEYALGHREELVLKPTSLHGGQGVLVGWHPDVTDEDWATALGEAMDGPFTLQRRIHPVPELFPGEDGEPEPWLVVWGVFTVSSGYGGVTARATRSDDPHSHVINVSSGASGGSALHAEV
ncbi:hypothetical protein [Kitasatospora sp. LaBMicrA B282]|uniref:hypothetical protein n=1 Tax=Kitasatospora sp. LaBMicrA B282 TaxID=3420949 RepID=UPI003D112271